MLRDFARKLYGQLTPGEQTSFTNTATPSPGTTTPGHGELTDVKLHLDQPFYGEVNGQPVTIIGEGNMRGFSPASWCVDRDKENAWLPTGLILITDPRFEPLAPGSRLPRIG
jgi:hypothetical protein